MCTVVAMDEQELAELGEELAREVSLSVGAARSRKWRCPEDLQARIVEYTKVCRERGEPYADIANRLDLIESTLTRWMRREGYAGPGRLRSVAIVAADRRSERDQHQGPVLELITPSGYRVQGLDADTLAYLLRVLE